MSRLVAFSDTHGHFPVIPDGKYLVFAGDYQAGTMDYDDAKAEARRFLRMMRSCSHEHKIIIPGNHDNFYWYDPLGFAQECADHGIVLLASTDHNDPNYLIKQVGGLVFCGTHQGYRHAKRPNVIHPELPLSSAYDVLLTHGPPYGIFDYEPSRMQNCGSEYLRNAFVEKGKPSLHIFGHIHEQYGRTGRWANVALCDNKHGRRLAFEPMVIDVSQMERK